MKEINFSILHNMFGEIFINVAKVYLNLTCEKWSQNFEFSLSQKYQSFNLFIRNHIYETKIKRML